MFDGSATALKIITAGWRAGRKEGYNRSISYFV